MTSRKRACRANLRPKLGWQKCFFYICVCKKTVGVILDQDMSLSLHIHKVINICYLNLQNLGKIDSKWPSGIERLSLEL